MSEQIKNILIIGAGRAGTALIKMFNSSASVKIIGVVDAKADALGMALAKQLNIPVAGHWSDFLKDQSLNEIVNATGKDDVHAQLNKDKPAQVNMHSESFAHALWFFAKEYETVEKKIQEAKEDIEAHEWGVQKTNEAIKQLYAELEIKNKELQELDRMKSDFISTVSHELRTPLAITKEGISLMQDGVLGPVSEKQTKVLTTARDSIDRLAGLIASLLDISKIEAGQNEIEKELISVNKIIKQVMTIFEGKAGDKGLDLRMSLPDANVDVFADNDKIVQVLTNLVNNAIKFTEKGSVEVALKDSNGEIECSVQDTGKGIAKEDIAKMFDKFQQINREHGDGEQGTGLGLSIAKSIIEAHDGEIWVESEEGKGTKVLFTLPKMAEEDLLRAFVDKGLDEAKHNNSKMSLMVVTIDALKKTKKKFSEEQIYHVLKGVEEVLKRSLDHSGGTALKNSHKCIVILPNSSKQNVLSAEGRLKQAVDDYLTAENLTEDIQLRFGCATYPDEASNCDELIKQALNN